MKKAESQASAEEPPADPDSTGASPESPDSASSDAPETWIERLKAAVGLRSPATIREELVEALAADDASIGFSPEERAMLANILRLREVRVDDVMVPRADIEAVEISVSLAGLLMAFEKSGHSRMPVYRETLDDPVGLVHIKDLMSQVTRAAAKEPGSGVDLTQVDLTRPLAEADIVRNILFVPPSMPVPALLAGMQASRMQMALVIDEYGGTDGLVSLEDIIELVVGEIEDEHDDETRPMIVPDGSGGFLADARADLEEVSAAVGADFSHGEDGEDVDTVGGLVYSLLGRIPVRGELVTVPGNFEFEILDADPRRIKRLRIYRREAGEPRRRQRASPSESGPAA